MAQKQSSTNALGTKYMAVCLSFCCSISRPQMIIVYRAKMVPLGSSHSTNTRFGRVVLKMIMAEPSLCSGCGSSFFPSTLQVYVWLEFELQKKVSESPWLIIRIPFTLTCVDLWCGNWEYTDFAVHWNTNGLLKNVSHSFLSRFINS